MPVAHINGANLYYNLDNFTGPWTKPRTVLLQHGMARNGKFWYRWVPLLSSQFQVLRPDLRGLGQSSVATESYHPSAETFIGDFLGLLDHLEIDKVVYVGEALGGILGTFFALAHPERITALVLTSTPLVVLRDHLAKSFPLKEGSWEAAIAKGADNWARQTMGQRIDLDLAPPQLVDWWISEMAKTNPENGVKLSKFVATVDLSPRLKEIKVPTLVLAGEKSPGVTPEQIALMRAEIPDVKVVVFPGVGMSPHAVIPERCVEEVLTFLGARGQGTVVTTK
ncbi:MAG: alpha/beta hydrolase [Chloroflexi bacterium]|nr:alpha/beta hydrolase [Chloroflexota bacterium]